MRTSTSPTVEPLEARRLLSATVTEAEPNNLQAHANRISRVLDDPVHVSGDINAAGDRDWFEIQLQAGDVVGAVVTGSGRLNPAARLVNAAGQVMIACDDGFQIGQKVFADESPLPRVLNGSDTDPELYYVIPQSGIYYVEVSASPSASVQARSGDYEIELLVARPRMEAQPAGAKQILFLDFDGARVDFTTYFEDPPLIALGAQKLSPLRDALPSWGMAKADINALIDRILVRVTDMLATQVQANGLNPSSGIEIRNSRDHRDTFGKDPLVARVVVGIANDPRVTDLLIGVAQDIDVGNFKIDDEAVVTMNWYEGPANNVPIQPPATPIDAAAEAAATIIAHEAGHLLGCFHTAQDPQDRFAGAPNLMDPDPAATLGPDFIFGSADDIPLHFGVDDYSSEDPYQGLNDTLNTVAFALSTGKGPAASTAGGTMQTHMLARARASSPSLFNALDTRGEDLIVT
jgi:hypothetical protein